MVARKGGDAMMRKPAMSRDRCPVRPVAGSQVGAMIPGHGLVLTAVQRVIEPEHPTQAPTLAVEFFGSLRFVPMAACKSGARELTLDPSAPPAPLGWGARVPPCP